MKLAVIACANGLGHVRRIISITAFMLKNGFSGSIDAYIPRSHINYFRDWDDCKYFTQSKQVSIQEFYYPQKNQLNTNVLYYHDWENINLPNLSKYDVVWSDNILQVLEKREDAILSGSFLWHEVFEKNINKNGLKSFVASQKKLLDLSQPIMIGNEYFSTSDVKTKTKFSPVGLYRYSILFKEKINKGILLSCGLGGEEKSLAKDAVEKIINEKLKPPDILFVEPRLLPYSYPDWIKPADFTDEMFQNCCAVCIRPGMGTLSDALISRNRVFAFSNDDSFEMIHNANVLEKMRIGQRSMNPYDAYIDAINYLNDDKMIKKQIFRTSHLRTDGVFATADIIANILS